MNTRALVSVVLPTRDRPELLRRSVAAVLEQDYDPVELIIVDDGSAGESRRVIEELRATRPDIRSLRHEEARGAAAARNAGAAVARGELLLFEDDDCRGEVGRIRKLAAALASAPSAGYAYGWGAESDAAGPSGVTGREGPWSTGTPGALVRSEVFSEVGGFDAGLPRLQDFDLWTRILARHHAVEVPEILFHIVRSGPGISTSTDRLADAASRIEHKYTDSELPLPHLAAMHRFLGGSLLVHGRRQEGLHHLRRAVRLDPSSPRGWLALTAGAAGPGAYRAAVKAQSLLGLHGGPGSAGPGRS